MFGFKKKRETEYEMTIKKFNKAYNNLDALLDKKTKELNKLIAEEEQKQNEMFAIMNYQMDILKAHNKVI